MIQYKCYRFKKEPLLISTLAGVKYYELVVGMQKSGEIFEGYELISNQEGRELLHNEVETDKLGPGYYVFKKEWLEEVPPEPQVVSTDKWINDRKKVLIKRQLSKYVKYHDQDLYDCAAFFQSNGRLERDLEYKEMRAFVKRMKGDLNNYYDAIRVFDNLPPLNKE